MERHLIIAHYNENIDWVKNIQPNIHVHVIDKKKNNIGRESYAYLEYIVDNYDHLDGHYIFCQGNPFDHCRDFIYKVNKGTSLGFYPLADNYITNNVNGQPNHNPPLQGDQICRDIGIHIDEELYFPTGAQFIVSSDIIKQRPKEFYSYCLNVHYKYQDAPWVFERIWHKIFQYPKASMTYYAFGFAVGDSLIAISSVKEMTKNLSEFGVIIFPNQEYLKLQDLKDLCELNLPNLKDIICLSQEEYRYLVQFNFPNYAECRPRGWERLVEEVSFLSGINKENIFPALPRRDYFPSSFFVKHNSNYSLGLEKYVLYNPISLQSIPEHCLYTKWNEVLESISMCKYPVVLVSKNYIETKLPNIINLSGQLNLFDLYALADKALFTITTANNLAFYCNFNGLPHFMLGNYMLDNKNLFFRKWLKNDDDFILHTHESISMFKVKVSKALKSYKIDRLFQGQCKCCDLWE